MKFTIAVVMMALAVSAQASYVPLAYSPPYAAAPYRYPSYAPLSYTARSLPLTYAAYAPATYAAYAPAPATYAATYSATYAAPAAVPLSYEYAPAIRSLPAIQQYHTVAELRSPAAIIPVAAEGTYAAVNKGAIHVAPLSGHSQSASSVNLEKAALTF